MAPAADDPALDTLFLPLASGAVAWPSAPGRALFLRARAGPGLEAARGQALDCEQSFKPWADALLAAGHGVVDAETGHFERVPVLRESLSGAELDWPFDVAAVQRFLDRLV